MLHEPYHRRTAVQQISSSGTYFKTPLNLAGRAYIMRWNQFSRPGRLNGRHFLTFTLPARGAGAPEG